MPKASPIFTNFSSGELSSRLEGRVDLPQFYNSCRTLENMILTQHGCVERRPGTYYVAEVKDSSKKVRLIPFEKDPDNLYVCEFGDQYIRFLKDNKQIKVGFDPYEISSPYLEADLFQLQYYQKENELWIVHLSYAPRKLTITTDTNWTLTAPSFEGWDESTACDITNITQANPIVVTAPGHGFANGDKVFIKDIKVETASWGKLYFGNIEVLWGMIEVNNCAFAIANKTTDTFELVGTNGSNYHPYIEGGTVRKKTYHFSTENNYPSCITFFEDRMLFAASNNNQGTIWGSETGKYTKFIIGTKDADAFEYTIPTKNRIRWLVAKNDILIGTNADEWLLSGQGQPLTPTNVFLKRQTIYGSANIEATAVNETVFYIQKGKKRVREFVFSDSDTNISPDLTILAEHITESGIVCTALQQNPGTVYWCVREDGVLIGLTYERLYQVSGWHRHVTDGVIESIAVISKEDEDELWISVKREIAGNTKRYIEYFKPRALSDQTDYFFVDSGITFDGGDPVAITGATVANPVVITAPGHGFANDQLVKIVNVEGMAELNTKIYMVKNKTTDTFELALQDGSYYINGTAFSAYICGGTAQRVWTEVNGLYHLNGKTVSMLCDGARQPDKVVYYDTVKLRYPANKIQIGLPYKSTLKTMRIEAGATDGTSQGKMKRIDQVTIRFLKTIGCKVGPDEDNLEFIVFREGNEMMNNPPGVFTGDKSVVFPGVYETAGDIVIIQDQPFPLGVVAVMPRLVTYD